MENIQVFTKNLKDKIKEYQSRKYIRFLVVGFVFLNLVLTGVFIYITQRTNLAARRAGASTSNLLSSVTESNQIVSATYDNPAPSNKDWIGIYIPSSDDTKTLDWKWLNNSQGTAPATVSTSGTVTFKQLPKGTYEVRYIKVNTAVSGSKTSGALIEIGGTLACSRDTSSWNQAGSEASSIIGTVVKDNTELNSALVNPPISRTISLESGVWKDLTVAISYTDNLNKPLTIRAKTPGKTTLLNPKIEIKGRNIVLDGFVMYAGSNTPVTFSEGSKNSRLTNTLITDDLPASTIRRPFVSLLGSYNRVDHTALVGGVMDWDSINVLTGNGQDRHHRIDHNYIGERTKQFNNWDGQAIQLGSGPIYGNGNWYNPDQNILVDENYFCGVNNAEEVISIKASKNYIYRNTFDSNEASYGVLTRFSDNSVIDSNYFLGNGKAGSSGVSLAGNGHVVTNNYIQNVVFAGIDVLLGTKTAGVNGWPVIWPAENISIYNNTLVNCENCLVIGRPITNNIPNPIAPKQIRYFNNIISSPGKKAVTVYNAPQDFAIKNSFFWQDFGNLTYSPTDLAWNAQPDLRDLNVSGETIKNPKNNSAQGQGVVNQGNSTAQLGYDIDGNCRSGFPDVGSHEFTDPSSAKVKTIKDVGPTTFDFTFVYYSRSLPQCRLHLTTPYPAPITSATNSGNTVTVNFKKPYPSLDWIGIFPQTADNSQLVAWKWLTNSQGSAPFLQPDEGSVTFDNLPNGSYEARYIFKGTGGAGYKTSGIQFTIPWSGISSTPVPSPTPEPEPILTPTPTPTSTLSPTNPLIVSQTNGVVSASYYNATPDTGDWIGIFNPTSYNNTPLDWKWLTNSQGTKPSSVSPEGIVTFKQLTAGTYEVRYIKVGTGSSAYKTAGVAISW